MAKAPQVTIQNRQPGKGLSKSYRKQKLVPAVIYGPQVKNQLALIDELFVLRHCGSRHESTIFQTQSDDKNLNGLKVMLKNIQRHPLSWDPLHVDMYALDMSASIKVNVTLDFQGEPAAVANEGALVQTVLREIEVECDPLSIPETIAVDISQMQAGDSLHVSEIQFPEGLKPITNPERTVITVYLPKPEAEPEEAAEAAPAAEGAEAPAADGAEENKDA